MSNVIQNRVEKMTKDTLIRIDVGLSMIKGLEDELMVMDIGDDMKRIKKDIIDTYEEKLYRDLKVLNALKGV